VETYNLKTNKIMKQEQECCQEVSGGYLGTTCPKCNKPFRSVIQEPKQETLLGKTISKKDADKDSFEDVTKYKIERSYSEEEVEILLETLSKVIVYQGNDYRLPHYFEFEIKEVIEQFKNK
jgi:hypothetical protein